MKIERNKVRQADFIETAVRNVTISLRDGEWVAAVLDSSDRDAYVDSLELIRGLDYDVLVPWAATAGGPYYAATSSSDARRRIDAILERVRRETDR